jgi:hypothetical protein
MSILFLASDASEVAGVATNTLTSTEYDTLYSDRAFGPAVPTNNAADACGFGIGIPAPSSDTIWLHFRQKANSVYSGPSSTNVGIVWQFSNAAGQVLATIACRGTTASNPGWRAEVFGDTTVVGTSFAGPYGATATFDIQLVVNSTNIILNVYMNGTLVSSATAANSTGLKGKPRYLEELNTNTYNKSSGTTYVIAHSELVVTDNESTVGWRIATLKPNANGGNTAWSGDFNDLVTIGDGTAISSATVGDKENWGLSAYGGPSSPSSIRGVVVKLAASKGTTGPQNIEPSLRISSTDYFKSPVSPDNINPIYADWTLNPATSAAWATGDLSTTQPGVRSAT